MPPSIRPLLALVLASCLAGCGASEAPSANPQAHAASERQEDRSIAVLPLANASGDPDQQYFSDGFSGSLITALSHYDGLVLTSRNRAFRYRDDTGERSLLAGRLGVAHLLEGSARHDGDKLSINVSLIRAKDGTPLWANHYERPYEDLFSVQEEIAQGVAAAMGAIGTLDTAAKAQNDRPPSGSLEAYDALLQGEFFAGTDLNRAIDAYTTATRLDPGYAMAWARLAEVWTTQAANFLTGEDARQAYDVARVAADTALSRSPGLAAAHAAKARLLQAADFDWNGAEAAFRRALELGRDDDGGIWFGLGQSQAALGRLQDAVASTRKAIAADPLDAGRHGWMSAYLNGMGQLAESNEAMRRAIELQPKASSLHAYLAINEILRGNVTAALATARAEPAGPWQDIALALATQVGPDRAAADAALQKLVDTQGAFAAYQIAQAYALRDDADQAFAWLERAGDNRDPGVQNLLFDPILLRYRDDARLAAFCTRANLPPPAQSPTPPLVLPAPAT